MIFSYFDNLTLLPTLNSGPFFLFPLLESKYVFDFTSTSFVLIVFRFNFHFNQYTHFHVFKNLLFMVLVNLLGVREYIEYISRSLFCKNGFIDLL